MMTSISDENNLDGKISSARTAAASTDAALASSGYRELVAIALRLMIPLMVFVLTMAWATQGRFVGENATSSLLPAIYLLVTELVWVCTWFVPAIGFGVVIHRLMFKEEGQGNFSFVALALGIAFLFLLDEVLGALGLLQIGGGTFAYLISIFGTVLVFLPKFKQTGSEPEEVAAALRISPFLFVGIGSAAAIVTALIFTAALSAPGFLWSSEFGGFDALSYHLQLPREWLAQGRIVSLEHNVYSFLPSAMESAFYHLAILRAPFKGSYADGMQAAVVSAQLLHAVLVIVTALTLAEFFLKLGQESILTVCLLVIGFMAVPWITVVGSLAYNEMPTLLFFVAALNLVFSDSRPANSRCLQLAIGFLIGSACAAKLTAVGFVAIPVVILVVLFRFWSPGQVFLPSGVEAASLEDLKRPAHLSSVFSALVLIAVGGFVALAPFALRNLAATNFTQPVFPFATSIFGSAHWTSEQVERFNGAHLNESVVTVVDRLQRLYEMAFVHAQWAYFFPIALVSGFIGLIFKATRRGVVVAFTILACQLLFWLFFTHHQSRFLIPCMVPLLMLCAFPLLALAAEPGKALRILGPSAAGVLLIINLTMTFHIYETERDGYPAAMVDALPLRIGTDFSPQVRQDIAERDPFVYLNINESKLKPGKIYLFGDATPLYLNPPYLYHTTWDTSPLGRVIRQFPAEPERWVAELVGQFDIRYVLINWNELIRYIEQDHWYDPDVTMAAVQQFRDSNHLRVIGRWPPNYELLELLRKPGM